MPFSVTRQQIIEAATSLIGTPFRHQGRDERNGVDCVGLLVVIGRKIGYPNIVDDTTYRRMPKAEHIRATILQNCDEIPIEEAGPGDFFLMRLTGRKLRHAAVKVSDETDIAKGIQPMLIHAGGTGLPKVKKEPISMYAHKIGAAFRVRGLVEADARAGGVFVLFR
jgi:cell wall-associated NlpC family hydrolase